MKAVKYSNLCKRSNYCLLAHRQQNQVIPWIDVIQEKLKRRKNKLTFAIHNTDRKVVVRI